jgi:hypothetical protein
MFIDKQKKLENLMPCVASSCIMSSKSSRASAVSSLLGDYGCH